MLLLTFKDTHFPVSRGKSKASAFSPPLREKEQWRKKSLILPLKHCPPAWHGELFSVLVMFCLGGSTLNHHLSLAKLVGTWEGEEKELPLSRCLE